MLLNDGQPVSLTPKAFELLAFLAANPGRLLTKDELLQAVWPDAVVEESNLAYTVFAIRKALGESAESARFIETVPKRGYRFVAPVVRHEPDADRTRRPSSRGSIVRDVPSPVGAPEPVGGLAVSPDGSFALVARHIPHNVVAQDLWLFDLRRETNPRRVTFAPTLTAFPVWVTSERFLFRLGGGPEGSVYEQTIGGQRRLLFSMNGEFPIPTSAVAGGRVVVFTTVADPAMGTDIWIWTDKAAPLITREGDQSQAQLSPDGRWLAYVSNETGRNEVSVASFRFDKSTGEAGVGDSMPVSDGGGFAPRWRGDGEELLYLKIDGSVMAIEADAARTFSSGRARRLFTAPDVLPEWGVTHDGSRILFVVRTAPPPPLNVIYDWQSALSK